MKRLRGLIIHTCFLFTVNAMLAAVIVAAATPAFAQGAYVDPYTLANRARAESAERRGDMSAAVTTRTDERYNNGSLFRGPRGWAAGAHQG